MRKGFMTARAKNQPLTAEGNPIRELQNEKYEPPHKSPAAHGSAFSKDDSRTFLTRLLISTIAHSVKRANGSSDGATAGSTNAIELKPDLIQAYFNRGNVRQLTGDLDGAITDYSKAIEHKPDLAVAYYDRGLAKQAKGDSHGAIEDYTRAIELKQR